jgi:hypothetical protein
VVGGEEVGGGNCAVVVVGGEAITGGVALTGALLSAVPGSAPDAVVLVVAPVEACLAAALGEPWSTAAPAAVVRRPVRGSSLDTPPVPTPANQGVVPAGLEGTMLG